MDLADELNFKIGKVKSFLGDHDALLQKMDSIEKEISVESPPTSQADKDVPKGKTKKGKKKKPKQQTPAAAKMMEQTSIDFENCENQLLQLKEPVTTLICQGESLKPMEKPASMAYAVENRHKSLTATVAGELQ